MNFNCMRDYIEALYELENRKKENTAIYNTLNRFSKYWDKTRKLYEEAGMSKAAIATMFAYDLNAWLKDIDFYENTTSMDQLNEQAALYEAVLCEADEEV